VRIALDTNILAYAEGVNGEERRAETLTLLRRVRHHEIVLPAQAFGELYNVLVRKTRWRTNDARAAVLAWRETFPLIATSPAVIVSAVDLAADHRFSIWDGVVLAAAASSGCTMLLSEDMQDGFVWSGVRVVNPFAESVSSALASVLGSGQS